MILLLSLYGLTMMWSPMFGTSEALLYPSLGAFSDEVFLSRVVCLAAYGLSMLALSLAGERLRPHIRGKASLAVLAITGPLGMAFGALPGLDVLPVHFLYVGALFRGVCYTLLAILWIETFVRLDWKVAGLSVAGSLMLYALIGMLAIAMSRLAPILLVVVLAACPLLAYWGCRTAGRSLGDDCDPCKPNGIQDEQRTAPLRTRLALYAANLLFGVMLGAILHHFAVADTLGAIIAFFAMAFALFVAVLFQREDAGFHGMYRVFMMGVAVAVPVFVVFDWLSLEVAVTGTSMILAVMIFFTVVIFSDAQARLQNPYWRVPAMGQVFAAAGMIISLAAFHAVFPEGMPATGLMLVAMACVIFVASVFSPSDRAQTRPWGFSSLIPAESDEIRRLRRCGEIADTFKLTSRELEILQQLVVGCTRDEIAATLVISPATAKTHIRNIYGKLGVHSQKELIELVNAG